MSKKIAIHQPQFLPYIGFFHKIMQCDTYVILDDVMPIRDDFTNRNKIKGTHGVTWLTIPVKKKNIIKDIEISIYPGWVNKHLKTIQHFYARTPYFSSYLEDIERIYKQNWEKLIDINVEFLKWVFKQLNINVDIYFSSDFKINSMKTQRLVDICKKVNADIYLSGIGAKDYMDLALFKKHNVEVEFQQFTHPVYPQRFGSFIKNLSIIDLLFNCGEKSIDIIKNV